MFETYRLFYCARCRDQVFICQGCDRGNIYCPPCAPVARRESQQRYGNTYQKTDAGKANHAARQQRYLDNKEQDEPSQHSSCTCAESSMMTQQGSAVADEASPLGAQPEVLSTSVLTKEIADVYYPLHAPSQTVYEAHIDGQTATGATVYSAVAAAAKAAQGVTDSGIVTCSFCGQRCGPYTRLDFLHTRRQAASLPAASV